MVNQRVTPEVFHRVNQEVSPRGISGGLNILKEKFVWASQEILLVSSPLGGALFPTLAHAHIYPPTSSKTQPEGISSLLMHTHAHHGSSG